MKKAILPFLFLSLSVQAANISKPKPAVKSSFIYCASNPVEFRVMKHNLPTALSDLPIQLGSEVTTPPDSNLVSMSIVDLKYTMEMNSKVLYKGAVYKDKVEIRKLCVNKKTQDMSLLMTNGSELKMQLQQSVYMVNGVTLKVLNKEQSALLNSQINSAPVPAANGGEATK